MPNPLWTNCCKDTTVSACHDKSSQDSGTIFAYGQTGSGKTHTMMGSGDDVGVIPLMNKDIFERVAKMTEEGTKFLITVSFLEIYNEVIKDLLHPCVVYCIAIFVDQSHIFALFLSVLFFFVTFIISF